LIAFLKTQKNAEAVASGMTKGFAKTGIESRTFICQASEGARLLTQ